MGDCRNYGPFWGPYYNTGPNTGPNLRDPKRDHNFDNPPYNFRQPATCNGALYTGVCVSLHDYIESGAIVLPSPIGEKFMG